jgi:hypothetical protein
MLNDRRPPRRQRSCAFHRLLLHCRDAEHGRFDRFKSVQNRVQSLRSLPHRRKLLQKTIFKLRIQAQFGEEPFQTLFAASYNLQLGAYKSVERSTTGRRLCHFSWVSVSHEMVRAISSPSLCTCSHSRFERFASKRVSREYRWPDKIPALDTAGRWPRLFSCFVASGPKLFWWWARRDSNPGPPRCKRGALTN